MQKIIYAIFKNFPNSEFQKVTNRQNFAVDLIFTILYSVKTKF